MTSVRERLDGECIAQSLTVDAQHARIDLLETALAGAQACAIGYQQEVL